MLCLLFSSQLRLNVKKFLAKRKGQGKSTSENKKNVWIAAYEDNPPVWSHDTHDVSMTLKEVEEGPKE